MLNERSDVKSTGDSRDVELHHLTLVVSLLSLLSLISIFIRDYDKLSHALTISSSGAMNNNDPVEHLTVPLFNHFSEVDNMILAEGSSNMGGAIIDNDNVVDMYNICTSINPDHGMITSTDVDRAERTFDLFDDILMGVHFNVTSIKTAVQTE